VLVATNGPSEEEVMGSKVYDGTLEGTVLTRGRLILDTPGIVDTVYVMPANGRLLAFERPAQIYLEDIPGGTLVPIAVLPDVQADGFKRGRLEPSGLPTHPVALVGARANTVYLGSADSLEWLNLQDGLSLGLTVRGFATTPEPNGDYSLYAGNTAGHMFQRRFSDQAWSPIPVRLDPALNATECAVLDEDEACGFARPQQSWQHFTVLADARGQHAVFGLTDLCSMAFIVRPDGCASSFAIEGLGPIGRSADDEIFAARNEAGFLTLATELGNVFEISRMELGLEP
jgi:hypothetical protein